MRRPVLYHRWPGHGLDIRIAVHPNELLFFAADVCRALQLPCTVSKERDGATTIDYPRPVVTLLGVPGDHGDLAGLWTQRDVETVAAELAGDRAVPFMTWLLDIVDDTNERTLAAVIDATTPAPQLVGHTLSVRRAAEILRRDPAIAIGQLALFEAMSRAPLAWIERRGDIWRARPMPVNAGLLTTQHVATPRGAHPQVRVTEAGLRALHVALGGQAPLDLTGTTADTLLDLD